MAKNLELHMKPEISVLLPLYKADKYIRSAISSILNQTFNNFELIIICDDPSDDTKKILNEYALLDHRVKVYYQEKKGLVESLNTGIDYSEGKYIARMDADDISLPERLEKQYWYMEKNPGIGVCGTNIETIDENGKRIGKIIFPTRDKEIKANLFFYSPFAHPSVIIRKKFLASKCFKYDPLYRHAEDYELWTRFSKITNFANLDDTLLLYRVHSSSIGMAYNSEQAKVTNFIRMNQIYSNLGLDFTDDELLNHISLCNCDLRNFDILRLISIENWLSKVLSKNQEHEVYPKQEFSYLILERYIYSCCLCKGPFFLKWRLFFNSDMSKHLDLNFIRRCYFKITHKNYLKLLFPILKS